MAEALGQAATQAPQPMQAAASMARSASGLGTRIALPSGALPVGAVMKPPAAMMRSKAVRSTTRSRRTGKARRAPGLDGDRVAVLEAAHVELAGGGGPARAVGRAVDDHAAGAADAFAAVVVEGDRLLALADEALVDDVEHLQERHVRRDVGRVVGDEPPLALAVLLPPDVAEVRSHGCLAHL